jgi:dienelactone hydrolase
MRRRSWARAGLTVAVLGALLVVGVAPCAAATSPDDPDEVRTIAGRQVAVWMPAGGASSHSLVLFSHGVGGCKTQSKYLMRALAKAGMLVVAPDHAGDKGSFCPGRRPTPDDMPKEFREFVLGVSPGGPTFYSVRGKDIRDLRDALLIDNKLSSLIDPRRVALVGHSLGGYTVLGLAGAWPSGWKMDNIAAVVALAPFVEPFRNGGKPAGIGVPVLYQVGTADGQAPPARLDELRIYTDTPSPACKLAYQGADHFAWTDLDNGAGFRDAIAADTVAFLKAVFDGKQPTKAILTQDSMADPCK